MNRAERRKSKATAAHVARMFAGTCRFKQVGQKPELVTNMTARKALQRAFEHMLRNGLQDHTTKLTRAQAAAFGGDMPPESPGVFPYLSVGVDVDGCGSFTINHVATPGAPPDVAEMMNRQIGERRLQTIKAVSGL